MSFDKTFGGTLRVPIIAAPMFLVSTPDMALACCAKGIMGSYPAHATRTREIFADWLVQTKDGLAELENPAPYGVNIVVHPTNERAAGDLALCKEFKVPVILTSKGAPEKVFDEIHEYGALVFHDVASARHAEKAQAAGADALIAVCSGAGGHTGTVNPFALLNEIRQVSDLPIILSGCVSTGQDVLAAQAMGADYVYMGTRFIATHESMATERYHDVLINSSAKDIFYTAALDGAPANWITSTLLEAGVDLDELATTIPGKVMASGKVKERYSKVLSAGQGVGMVKASMHTGDLCDQLISEYHAAKSRFTANIS